MNKKIFLLLPALGLFLGACQPVNGGGGGGQQQESIVDRVEVDHDAVSLEVGQTFQLNASVKPISLDDRSVTWSSDHPEFAAVDASGMVTAVAPGVAHVRATANAENSKFGECTVTVTPEMVTVALTDPAAIMASTETLKFGANQKNVGKYYFFKGTVGNDTRGETSESWADGVEVKLENAGESKYYITFNDAEGKKYFEMDDDHHYEIVATPTEGRKWDWNETYGTVQRTIGSKTYLPGTYNTYTTISGCDLAQAATDFFFQFVYKTEPVAPTSITLSAASDKVFQGGTLQIEAELAPAAAKGNLNWTVTGDEHVSVSNKGLVSATEEATLNAQVTVRAAYAEDETVYGELTLTVAEYINYGTLEEPLTVAEAKAVIDKFTSLTAEKIFVKGFVSAEHNAVSSSVRNDVWLTNDDGSVQKDFELYSVYSDTEYAANGLVGKEVIAEGWGTKYNDTYEFSNKDADGNYANGSIRAVTNNTRTATAISFNGAAAFEVEVEGEYKIAALGLPYGSMPEIQYAVSPANQGVTYENGKVVVAANGTTGNYTLTASSGTFDSVQVSFTVIAKQAKVTFTHENSGWTTTAGAQTGTVSGITLACSNGVVGTSAGTTQMRVYKNATLTISGKTITKVEFSCTANGTAQYGPGCFTVSTGSYTYESSGPNGTWTGSATSVVFTASTNQVRAVTIVVYYAD